MHWMQNFLDISNASNHGNSTPVSYTHLDVYKRQALARFSKYYFDRDHAEMANMLQPKYQAQD